MRAATKAAAEPQAPGRAPAGGKRMIVLYGCLFCIALGTAVLILFLKPRFSPRRVWGLVAALAGQDF